MENQYLINWIPERASMRSNSRTVVPAAVEQHDFPGRWQVRYIALEVPLGAFAIIRGGQGSDPANPGVQPLGDALDHADFTRCVAAFEQDHHLVPGLDHPALQLHQFALQTKQLAEVQASRSFFRAFGDVAVEQVVEVMSVLGQLQFQLFVIDIDQFAMYTTRQSVGTWKHGGSSR